MNDIKALIVSAEFWCVLLALLGTVAVTVGASMVLGVGYGLLMLGVLCLAGANVMRRGLHRV